MNTQLRVLIVLVLCFLSQAALEIQVENSIVESNNEWTRILLRVTGGVPPYNFTYTWIPTNWKQVNNQIYLPITTFAANRKYPCKVIIKDSGNEEIRTTVVFSIRRNSLKIGSQLFPYEHEFEDSFFNEGGFQGQPEMKQINNDPIPTIPEVEEIPEPPPPV